MEKCDKCGAAMDGEDVNVCPACGAEFNAAPVLFERRMFNVELEVRAAEGGVQEIRGHAAIFNTPADLGWFIETVKPGAFAKSIQSDDIRALFNHDPNLVLGRNKANTLFLDEDGVGLSFRTVPGSRSYELDLIQSIKRGDVTQASFGFNVISRTLREGEDGKFYRDLNELKLFDVSPVTFPAYPQTDVTARALRSLFEREKREIGRGTNGHPEAVEIERQRELLHRQRMLDLVRS